LITCLFSWDLIFPIFLWLYLFSSYVCRIPFRIFCSGGLVIIYCFSFSLSWKNFIPPSILNDSFTGYSILRLKLFSFSAQNTSPHVLPAFNVSVEKSVIFMDLPLYVIFFLSYNLPYSFFVLCACSFKCNMPLRHCVLIMSVWCSGPSCTWMGIYFLDLGNFLISFWWHYYLYLWLAPLLLLQCLWFIGFVFWRLESYV
jgi:hypothetical protein